MEPIAALIVLTVLVISYFYWLGYTSKKGAPFVPLTPDIIERMLELAKVSEGDIVYDLGSGDGRIPIFAALKYKAKSVGIEVDKLRYFYSNFLTFVYRLRGKVTFLNQNIFSTDLSQASVVTMFLLQGTNEALAAKLLTELRPGTRIVSAAFNLPGWKPLHIDREHTTPYGPLYLYQIGVSNR